MGRKSTKENKSIWQTTREELGLTREKAGELVPGFSPERIEKIENGRTQIQPEDVILLAEHYRAPALLNYYCCNECPIGETQVVRAESKELTQIAVETLNAVNQMDRIKNRLLEIAEDGQVCVGFARYPCKVGPVALTQPPQNRARSVAEGGAKLKLL